MRLPVLFSALAAVIIFGASPVAAKIAVSGMAAMDVALLRTVIGGLFILPIALLMGIRLPQTGGQKWLLLLSGFCGFVGFPVLFTLGIQLTSANHASMILAALPILTGAIAMTWDNHKPNLKWITGCLVALAGESVLIFGIQAWGSSMAQASSVSGDLLVLCSNLFAALGYVAGGRLQRSGYPARGTTFWGVSIFAVVLVPLLPFVIDVQQLGEAGIAPWLGLLYLAIGVTIIGYMLWYWALGSGGIARVGLLQFLQPLSGVLLAWLLLGELLSAGFFGASVIILAGIALAISGK